jgi:hypothetical protein
MKEIGVVVGEMVDKIQKIQDNVVALMSRKDQRIDELESRLEETKGKLATAVKYLRQGKAQFRPHTTNSDVDEFLKENQ